MEKSNLRVLPCGLVLAALSNAVLAATPVVSPSASNLPLNATTQLQLFISGTDFIVGEDLNIQINSGSTGPTFTSVDILSGTIFASSNNGQQGGIVNTGPAANRLITVSATTVSPDTVVDNGLLVTLNITTNASSGSFFDLNLLNTLNGPSDLVLADASTISFLYPHIHMSIGDAGRQWVHTTGGTWDLDSNWTPFAPYANGDIANFLSAVPSGTANVTLDGNRAAGVLNFNNSAATYVIAQGSGGTLSLNNGLSTPTITDSGGSHTISAPLALAASTNITVTSGADVLTISGNVSGASSNITLAGAGKLVLSGANSYANTSIGGSSTLQVGSGGTTGTLGTGPVSNSGTLAFNRSDTPSFNNAVSGSGGLTNTGTGTVSLTGAANYTGPTVLSAGTLRYAGGVTHNVGTISGPGSLFVDSASTVLNSSGVTATGTWTITGGKQNIVAGANTLITGPNGSKVNAVPTLGTSGTSGPFTGTLNLNNNALIVQTTSTSNKVAVINQLNAAITSGSNGAIWTGTGITSATAAGNPSKLGVGVFDNAILLKTSFGGQSVDSTSVLAIVAHLGDANRDGITNIQDISIVANNWQQARNNWTQGDLNRDGIVNIQDSSIVANNWQQTSSFNQFASQLGVGGGNSSAVPEPASLVVLALGGLSLITRRKRKLPPIT